MTIDSTPAQATYPLLDPRSHDLLTVFQEAIEVQLIELNDRWNEPGPATNAMRLGIGTELRLRSGPPVWE